MNWRTALVYLLGSTSCSIAQVRSAPSHQSSFLNHRDLLEQSSRLRGSRGSDEHTFLSSPETQHRFKQNLFDFKIQHDNTIANIRKDMSEPLFMAEVPSNVEQILEQNIISSLSPTHEAS